MGPLRIVEFVTKSLGVDESHIAPMIPCIYAREIAKGSDFLSVGSVPREIGLVESGLLKIHGQSEFGRSYVAEFSAEGELVADYVAMMSGKPSALSVTALEDSVISVVAFDDYVRLLARFDFMKNLARCVLEALLAKLARRERQFLTQTATERYLQLIEDRPGLLGRVSRFDIAAYLGVTPASLSRLTAQIRKAKD